jgi:hypothetical protein
VITESEVLTNLFLPVFKTGKEMPSTDGTETVSTVRRSVSDGNGSEPYLYNCDVLRLTNFSARYPGVNRCVGIGIGQFDSRGIDGE